ncbi:MAG: alpha-galactosidase [Alistipes sp.]
MIRKTILGLFLAAMLSTPLVGTAQSRIRIAAKGTQCEKWIGTAFAKGKLPPFSFTYGGTPSGAVIASWRYSAQQLPSTQPNVQERLYTYTDPTTGLQVACQVKLFTDFNAMEWVLRFHNTGAQNTPQIEHVKVVDLTSEYAAKGDLTLHYANGSNAGKDDFHARTLPLAVGGTHSMHPTGGRSSQMAFPFFNVQSPTGGMVVAIGWTGNWLAEITRPATNASHVATGMLNLSTYLLPDEQIRTPSTAMLLWQGDDRMVGQNTFRRFLLAHHHPQVNGKPAVYPICSSFNYGDPAPCNEYSCMTADYAIALVRRYKQFELLPEVFWLDAGWYSKAGDWREHRNWANTVGNWSVDPYRFPEGLGPVADEVHRAGCKFMVWFEPERVMKGSDWALAHPEFMLDASGHAVQPDWIKLHDQDSYLFNLGDTVARKWFCEQVAKLIRDNRIDYYRQDFNMEPEGFWYAHNKKDRVGVSEIRYIEGLYAFWDYLRAEFPNLLIDNCASGGRRIDLETTSRSAPLWRTDYSYGEPIGYQCHTYGLNQWLPVHGTGTYKTDAFSFRSSLGAAVIFNWKITNAQLSITDMQQRMAEYAAIQPYFLEDYYPLTDDGDMTSDAIWLAYQLNRPADQTGYIVAFRRDKAPEASRRIQLRGLEATATYIVEDVDTNTAVELSGSSLMAGYDLSSEQAHTSKLLKYHKK